MVGRYLNGVVHPLGSSIIVTRVPARRGSSSSRTVAEPSGRAWASSVERARRIGREDRGVIADGQRSDADGVVEARSGSRESRVGGADLLGTDDPLRVAARIGEDREDAFRRRIDVALVSCHDTPHRSSARASARAVRRAYPRASRPTRDRLSEQPRMGRDRPSVWSARTLPAHRLARSTRCAGAGRRSPHAPRNSTRAPRSRPVPHDQRGVVLQGRGARVQDGVLDRP